MTAPVPSLRRLPDGPARDLTAQLAQLPRRTGARSSGSSDAVPRPVPRSRPLQPRPGPRPGSAPPVPRRGVRLAVPMGSGTRRSPIPFPDTPQAQLRPAPLQSPPSGGGESPEPPDPEHAQAEVDELAHSDLHAGRGEVSAWPASSSGKPERAPCPQLYMRMQTYIEDSTRKLAQLHAPAKPPPEESFRALLEAFRIFVDGSTEFRPLLQKVLDAASHFIGHHDLARQDYRALEDRLLKVDKEYLDIVTDMRTGFAHHLQLYKTKIEEHQAEMHRLLMLVDMVNDRNRGMKGEVAAARARAEEADNAKQITVERMRYKRNALREMQERTQTLVQENNTLYQVAQYNEDLLLEIEERRREIAEGKEELARAEAEKEAAVQRQRDKTEQCCATIRSLQLSLRRQLAELTDLRAGISRLSAEVSECRQQRDELMTNNTPRPDFLQLDKALPAAGLTRIQSTYDRVAKLTTVVPRLQQQRDELERRLQSTEQLHAFLSAEDTNSVIRDVPLPPGGRCCAGQGLSDLVRPYQRYLGQVRLRNFTLLETRQMLLDFDAYVEKVGYLDSHGRPLPDAQPLDELFAGFLQTKCRKDDEMVAESAYNLIDALERHRYEPEVLAFGRALVHQDCSYQLFREVTGVTGTFRAALEQLDSKFSRQPGGRPGVLKRRVLHDLLAQLSRGRSEADLMRLKAALDRDMKKKQQGLRLGRDEVPWELVIQYDPDGHTGDLLFALRDQVVCEHDDLRAEVETLAVGSSTNTGSSGRFVSAGILRTCLLISDPLRLPSEADSYAAYACQLSGQDAYSVDDPLWNRPAPLYPSLLRARGLCLMRQTKRPDSRPKGWLKSSLGTPSLRALRKNLEEALQDDGHTVVSGGGLGGTMSRSFHASASFHSAASGLGGTASSPLQMHGSFASVRRTSDQWGQRKGQKGA
eukprot:TRINITY_DN362_c1_g1_i1.p1 TRINITY_DN362_c1_g1~~TRINITY_DN362_c1_g1_i1.p1  ORF type:complete len:925 (+),score=288.26 TRINITY_DN362_c1_g1_i1:75-2849(+)